VNFLWRLALQKKKLDDSLLSMFLKACALPDRFLSASVTRKDLQFGT
jgi:hypothetical protein